MHMKMEIKLVIIFHHHHDEKNKQTQYSMKKRKQTKKDGGKYAEHNMKNMNVFFGNMQADEFQIDILFHFFFFGISHFFNSDFFLFLHFFPFHIGLF